MANALGVKEPQDVYTVAVQVFPVTKQLNYLQAKAGAII